MSGVHSRRRFLEFTALTLGLAGAGCSQHLASKRFPGTLADFKKIKLTTYHIGDASAPAVVVLHEMPGLTVDDLALARALSKDFSVYIPVLFGEPEQYKFIGGYRQACSGAAAPFNCSDLMARSRILDQLDMLCEEVARDSRRSIGVIGMCLTGIFPLALLPHQVGAAVVCQPTVPFSIARMGPSPQQAKDLGLSRADLKAAKDSSVPFLVVHYKDDKFCPAERVNLIRTTFKPRVAVIELAEKHHSTLAGDFHPGAFDDVVTYLKVRLGLQSGPGQMKLARLEGAPCAIDPDGTWKPASA